MTESAPLASLAGANGTWDVYESIRTDGGWRTIRHLSQSGAEARRPLSGGVSADHRYIFSNGEDKIDYLGNPDGTFELTGVGSKASEPYAQGRYISPDGERVIFSTGLQFEQSVWCANVGATKCKVQQLEENAPPKGTGAIYERGPDGPTHVVSLLPGDLPPAAGENAFYKGTSKDGTAVAFRIGGVLYVRVSDNADGETVKVAEGSPEYAGLSDDGRYLFYVVGGNIYRFDTVSESSDQVNSTGDGKIVNVSGNGSHVYFISPSQINGQGISGEPNMYAWSDGSPKYIATVLPSDEQRTSGTSPRSPVNAPALTNWTAWVANPYIDVGGPGADSSRTTPDGRILIFESKAQLTSYDNDGHTEIYRYDDGDHSLVCVSCNFSNEAAIADARLQDLILTPPWIVLHNLSENGNRVFFETAEPLIPTDTDAVNSIYEWQKGPLGEVSVALISSGKTHEYQPPPPAEEVPNIPYPNVLVSITPSGDDVMFLAQEALVPGAPGSGATVVYDARVNGGLPPQGHPELCTEEECRRSSGAFSNAVSGASSETLSRYGNVKRHKHAKRRCRHRVKHRRCPKPHLSRPPQRRPGTAAVPARWTEAVASASGATESGSVGGPVSGLIAPSLSALVEEYEIVSARAEESTTAAGLHPDFTTLFALNHSLNAQKKPESETRTEDVSVSIPPGLLGNPNAVPRCEIGELAAYGNCPTDSQVGIASIAVENFGDPEHLGRIVEPIYNLAPPHPEEEVARLGFMAAIYPVSLEISVNTAGDYGVTAEIHGSPSLASLLEAETTLWGNPADSSHDSERLTPYEAGVCEFATACKAPGGQRASTIPLDERKAFMSNPSACQEGKVDFAATSYQRPGQIATKIAVLPPITNCQGLPFSPNFSATPTSHVAGAPTGLKTTLVLPQHLGAEEPATATMREARVTLPQGMQVNPAAANWIEACSEAQVGFHQEVDAACPDGSKLGTATIKSPALPEPIQGTLYQRQPTPGHQLGLWLVADALGLHIKLPGELEPDKATGRLTAVFSDLPQVPVEEIDLNVWGGPRAPLINPDSCGTYQTDFSFAPHSQDPAVAGSAPMQINEGCSQPFSPKLNAGTTNPKAGTYSPLIVDLERQDGDQALRGFELKLPDGLLAKIKGVGRCSDQQAEAGSCPADSRIGTVTASAGAGPDPLWVPQPGRTPPAVYLGGPYEGSPLSVVTIVPAQAGPFDLGNLVVRSGLGLDPDANRPAIKADPLPQFFEGVGLDYRRLHVVVDRPKFTLNPTDCRAMKVNSVVTSTQGTVAHPFAPFQVGACKRLKFKPSLSLSLKGGTKRSDYPALTVVLKARKGDANIARAQVSLPHSEFLAQEHIVTICTRKQFAAGKCPKGSIYGEAKAWTPLLAKPLSGPVYLRSSDNPLPDMVMALHGDLDVNLVGRIDSHNGGIRSTFAAVPDAPVTKFVLRMKGGAKGLLVNSTDICLKPHRVQAPFRAQNGRAANLRPALQAKGCGGGKTGKRGKGKKGGR